MFDLRVLITTYHEAFITRAGGEFELQSIAEGLCQLGMIVDIYGPYSRPIEFYDVVLHFSVHPGGLALLREIKRFDKPVVLWPNVWSNLASKEAVDSAREHVQIADYVTLKSISERDRLLSQLHVDPRKQILCRWIADMSYLKPAPTSLFGELYGVRDYGIWFGIIEPVKNQLAAIRVLREKGIPLVLVGKYRDEAYMKACKVAGADNVLFIEGLPQNSEIVRSALQSSIFYVELSLEPPGLSAIEAGLSGCRLLLSKSDWALEHFDGCAVFVDPFSDRDIEIGVDRVLEMPKNNKEQQNRLLKYCFPDALKPLTDALVKAAK